MFSPFSDFSEFQTSTCVCGQQSKAGRDASPIVGMEEKTRRLLRIRDGSHLPARRPPSRSALRGILFRGLLVQRPDELVRLLFGDVLGGAVSLLKLADKLLSPSIDHVEIIVGQLAPLLLHPPFVLLPLTFHLIPIHLFLLGRHRSDAMLRDS